MVEAAGIEPKSLPVLDLLYAGLMGPKAGQGVSQPGQGQNLTSGGSVELGTEAQGEPVTSRTDQEHKISIKQEASDRRAPDGPDPQLQEVVAAWPLLPSALRGTIAAVVRAVNASGQVRDPSERHQGDQKAP